MTRRDFVRTAAWTGLAAVACAPGFAAGASKRAPRVLLRGSWKSMNIGDVAHTPGALRLFERFFPEAEITLWPGGLGDGEKELLIKSFPRLRIAKGGVNALGGASTPELAEAWSQADFLVHGSASGFGARAHVEAWHRATGRPYGAFGISMDPVSGAGPGRRMEGGTLPDLTARIRALPPGHLDAAERKTVDGADFIFCRETLSRDYLRAQGVRTPVVEFGPDSTFSFDLRDDAKAAAYLETQGLRDGEFICIIPRLRYTPYHLLTGAKPTADDHLRDAINAQTAEPDHAKLRQLMITWVRKTGLKVLACPEMIYQIDVARERLVEPLPDDVRRMTVWRDRFWMPDEAASVYARARAVISMECHSPILALTRGTPMLYVREPTDTIKGYMFRDVGLGDWIFDVETASPDQLWSVLSGFHANPAAAAARVQAAVAEARQRQQRMTDVVRQAVLRARDATLS